MAYTLSLGIDFISALLALLPILGICLFLFPFRSFKQTALFTLFVFYLCAVFSIVGVPSIYHVTFDPSCNLIPLLDGIHAPLNYLKNTVLNVLLFFPLGVLLPVIWEACRSWKRTLLWGFGLSLVIELLQLFTYRLTDVDDLITNTLGAVLGYCLAHPFFSTRPPVSPRAGKTGRYESLALALLAFLVMFITQPLISDVLWETVLETSLWNAIK